MALNLVPQEKRRNLENAIEKAKSLLDKFNGNEQEALKEAGVSTDFIEKIKKNLNTPLGQSITSAIGLDSSQAEDVMSNLTSNCPPPPSPISNKPVTAEKRNEMMNALRKGLKRL